MAQDTGQDYKAIRMTLPMPTVGTSPSLLGPFIRQPKTATELLYSLKEHSMPGDWPVQSWAPWRPWWGQRSLWWAGGLPFWDSVTL